MKCKIKLPVFLLFTFLLTATSLNSNTIFAQTPEQNLPNLEEACSLNENFVYRFAIFEVLHGGANPSDSGWIPVEPIEVVDATTYLDLLESHHATNLNNVPGLRGEDHSGVMSFSSLRLNPGDYVKGVWIQRQNTPLDGYPSFAFRSSSRRWNLFNFRRISHLLHEVGSTQIPASAVGEVELQEFVTVTKRVRTFLYPTSSASSCHMVGPLMILESKKLYL